MKTITISADQAVSLVKERKTTGRWFGVTTIKRTNGDVRNFVCRGGVRKGVTGQGLAFNPSDKGLLGIWDTFAKGFRFLDLNAILEVRITGTRYVVK